MMGQCPSRGEHREVPDWTGMMIVGDQFVTLMAGACGCHCYIVAFGVVPSVPAIHHPPQETRWP